MLVSFSSAVFLPGADVLMVIDSVQRMLSPQPIHYRETAVVAVIGLLVNIVCAVILGTPALSV